MKKLIYSSLILLVLLATSCKKEVFRPSDANAMDAPNSFSSMNTQDSNEDGSSVNDKGLNGTSSSGSSSSNDTDDGTITDPNNDPDSRKKGGKK